MTTAFEEFEKSLWDGNTDNAISLWQKEYADKDCGMGLFPAHVAASFGYDKLLSFFLESGCDIEAESAQNSLRPLHLACINGREEVLRLLIANKCSLDPVNKSGKTALDLAIQYGHDGCFKILSDAISSHQKSRKLNEFHIRLRKYAPGNVTVEYLQGAQPLEDQPYRPQLLQKMEHLFEEFALFRQITVHKTARIERLMKPSLLNRKMRFQDGATLCELIAQHHCTMIMSAVFPLIFEINEETWRKIERAAAHNRDFRKMLPTVKARRRYMEHQTSLGYTRLHIAVADDEDDMVEWILENRLVDINAGINTPIGSPYAYAMALSSDDIAEILADNGADVSVLL